MPDKPGQLSFVAANEKPEKGLSFQWWFYGKNVQRPEKQQKVQITPHLLRHKYIELSERCYIKSVVNLPATLRFFIRLRRIPESVMPLARGTLKDEN
jgi:hypothetical protein